MSAETTLVIVPGWKNSSPAHWQSLWAKCLPGAARVNMADEDWQRPKRSVWVQAIAQTILAQPGPVVMVAHSLGCIATTWLPPEVAMNIRGALLVAPADPERRGPLADFAPVPYQPLPYRSIVVTSSNDPFCPARTAAAFARSWGSEVVRLQNAGHINVESGFGEWPLGLHLLQSLTSSLNESGHPQAQLQAA